MQNRKAFWRAIEIGYHFIDYIRNFIIVSTFSAIIIVSFLNVLMRYLPWFKSLTWAEEFSRYANVWVVFLGASIAAKYSEHLKINILSKHLPENYKTILRNIIYITIFIFLSIIIIFGIQAAISNITRFAQDFPVRMVWYYLSIPIGAIYIFIEYFLIFIYRYHPFFEQEKRG